MRNPLASLLLFQLLSPKQKIYTNKLKPYFYIMAQVKLWNHDKAGKILSIVLVITVTAGIAALGHTLSTNYESEDFSEFYILGHDGMAEGYPTKLRVGESVNVITGISNHEGKETSYQIEILSSNKKITEIGPILLADDETWEDSVSWIANTAGEEQKIEFFLYKDDALKPLFEPLHLIMDVGEVSDK